MLSPIRKAGAKPGLETAARMSVSSASPEVLCFGLFELNLRTGQLSHQGRPVRLQEQPLQLLALLAQRPGQVVDREEIRQKLWAGDMFVEFDDSVNHAIRKVREALGDSASNPRFVETLPRQGYRFIAPVQIVPDQNDVPTAPSVTVSEPAFTAPEASAADASQGFLRLLGKRSGVLSLLGVVVLVGLIAFFLNWPYPREPQIKSLAVLPLENLTGDPTQEYFSDGVTEAIITDLGQIKGIRVISRTSVVPYKRGNRTMPQIAHDLDVDALVEGGIVRHGGRVRITAQLIALNPERHIWADSYERDAGDIIALQRQIAEDVARQIRTTIRMGAGAAVFRRQVNPQAYELYLRGREHLNDLKATDFRQAVQYFNQAILLDPDYAPAHASLAIAYTQMGFLSAMPRDEASKNAKQAAARALALNENLAEAHTANAYATFFFDWDWRGPDLEFQRSLELNPNSADAHLLYSVYLTLCGRFDDAIRENQIAINLDPLNSLVNVNLGWTYFMARRYAEGIAFMQTLRQRDPNYPFLHHHLASLYSGQGNCAAAVAEAEYDRGFDMALVYGMCGKRERTLQMLGDAEREVAAGKLDPMYPALMYAVLGEREQAFRWLDYAIRQHSTQAVFVRAAPELDNIRADPRFAAVLRRVGAN